MNMKLYHLSSWELRKQLLVLIVLIFIPLLVTLLFTGYKQHQLTLQETENSVKRLISLFVKEQLSIISQTRQFLNVLSHVPAVRNLDFKRCNAFLKTIHQENPQYSTIVAANSEGIIDCCAIPLKKSINVADRSWFKRIKESKKFIIDNFLISRSAKKASLPFAYPVSDSDGNLKVAVGAAFDLKHYENLFKKISLPKDSVIIITDSEGKLLYQSFSQEKYLGKSIVEAKGFDIPKIGKGSFEVTETNGNDRIYWFEWLWVGQKNNEICLMVGISKRIMFANIKKALVMNITVLTLVALFFLTLAWFSGKKLILDPINFLIEKTKNVKRGESADLKYKKHLPGELYILSQALDTMISDLSQRETERDQALTVMKKELAERKKTEAELREREERLNILFEQAADSIYVCKPDGFLVKINQAACKATGYTENEMMNLNITDIDTVTTTSDAFSDFYQTLSPGKPIHIESVHRRKDGSTFPVETTAALLKTPDGFRIMGISRDITNRLKLENRIRQTQKLESIGNLAGGIAHDFNNILYPIVGISEMLMEDLLPNSMAFENVQRIFNAGIRGSELVKQILTFSRQSEHKKVPVKFQKVLQEVFKLTRSTIPINIEIIRDIQSDCGQIMADPVQLHQVAMNLITNAYHAMNHNSGKISIQLKEICLDSGDASLFLPEQDKYAMLTVSDTGTGIEPDIIGRIFDPYFTTKETGKGTGLGLATVYGIIKEHCGDIKVYSEPGKGTAFNIYLPLIKTSNDTEVAEKIQKLPIGNERILLVDDEEVIALLEKQMLERLGYRVTEKCSSVEALKVFKTNPDAFDLVISDMTMPNITGDQLAREIISVRPEMPVIICTGFSERINREKAKVMGIKGFLMKPVLKSKMAETVRKVLDEKNSV